MKKLFCLVLSALLMLLSVGCGQEAPAQTTTAPTAAPTTEPTAEPTTEPTTEPTVAPDKLIALTFDDGPNKNNTMEDVLDILKAYKIKATFFLIGNGITVDTKAVVKRAYDEGHELGSHGYTHTNMTGMTADEVMEEYQKVQDLVKAITGEEPKLFRAPFLAISDTMRQTIPAPFINGFGAGDYEAGVVSETIAARVFNKTSDGAVILLHVSMGYNETEAALHIIIPELKKQGYEFVTVSELFARQGITPVNGQAYDIISPAAE